MFLYFAFVYCEYSFRSFEILMTQPVDNDVNNKENFWFFSRGVANLQPLTRSAGVEENVEVGEMGKKGVESYFDR